MIKKIASLILKITICALLIFWLIKTNRFDLISLKKIELSIHTVLCFFVGFLSVFCGLFLLGLRLWILLRFKRFTVSFKRAFGITLLGSFWGVVLPGLAGGDAVKAGYLFINVSERRMDAVSAIFMDRAIGLFSLFLIGAIAAFAAYILDIFPLDPIILAGAPIAVILMCIGAFLFNTDILKNSMIKRVIHAIVPKKIRDFAYSIKQYLQSPKLILLTITLSVLNHILVLFTFMIAATLIDDNISVFIHFILNPLAMAMNMIPITPGGLGMAESAFSLLFQFAGSPNGAAIGFVGRFIQYGAFVMCGSITLILMKFKDPIFSVRGAKTEHVISNKIPEYFKG